MGAGSSSNDLSYNIDPKSALAAVRQIEESIKQMGKSGVVAGDQLDSAIRGTTDLYKTLLTQTDKQAQAQNRLARSIAVQAEQAGRTGEDRLVAKRDAIIRQLGQNQKAIDSVTESYKKLIDVERRANQEPSGGGGHGGIRRFAFLGGKDLLEGRSTNAIAEGANILTRLGGASLVIGSITAAFVGAAAAGSAAVKSLAEYGTQMKDLELRTGLTARETAQFSFAAKAVGQDVSIVERLMKGLTQATEDLSPAGAKGRKTLQDLGVSITDLHGKVRPTSELLLDISDKFSHLDPGTKLANASRDLFSRIGPEAIPFLRELRDNSIFFDEHGLPAPKQSDIDKYVEYEKRIAAVDVRWEAFKRGFKDVTATVFLNVVERIPDVGSPTPLRPELRGRIGNVGVLSHGSTSGDSTGIFNILSNFIGRDKADNGSAGLTDLRKFLSTSAGGSREAAERELANRRQTLDEARTAAQTAANSAGILKPEADKLKQDVIDTTRAYEKQEEIVKRLNKEEAQRLNYATEIARMTSEVAHFQSEARFGGTAVGKLRIEQDESLRGLRDRATNAGISTNNPTFRALYTNTFSAFTSRIADKIREEVAVFNEDLFKLDNSIQEEFNRGLLKNVDDNSLDKRFSDRQGADIENFLKRGKALTEIDDINLSGSRSNIERQFGRAGQISTLSNEGQSVTQANVAYQLRIQLAQQLNNIETDRINRISDGNERAVASARQQKDLFLELAQAQDEYDLKRLQIIHQQTDEIKGQVNSLVTTLFTKPSDFGKQLGSTLKTAALRPITEGISQQIATVLQPVIFGTGGNGGINAALRGGTNSIGAPLFPAANALTYAASALTSAAGAIAGGGGVGTAGGGFSLPSSALGGGTSGNFGGVPSFSSVGAPGDNTIFGNSGPGSLGGLFGAPGGTAPFFSGGDNYAGSGGSIASGSRSSSGLSKLASILGGGGPGLGKQVSGFGSLFNSIFNRRTGDTISTNFGGYLHPSQGGYAGTSTLGTLSTAPLANTPLAGVGSGVGVAIAEHGLLGEQRGTFAGTLQGAAGGFLIAGPIGAAVGAAIGLGEQIAGVESPRREAIRLIRATYGITINNATADQIVSVARQSYGARVSLAIRSPEVRQLLGLYAAGTGQASRFPQSADTPHGGGLIESGGRLFQQATSLYGNQYAYSSNLPVFGGGTGVGTLPSPGGGGNLNLSLNVAGDGIASFLQGQVITPEYVAGAQDAAWRSSVGRVSSAIALRQPGSIVS